MVNMTNRIIHHILKILYIRVVHELSRKPGTAMSGLAVNRENKII